MRGASPQPQPVDGEYVDELLTSETDHGKHFYVWVLPLVWTACSALAYHHPGDEYALWIIGSAAGFWGALILTGENDISIIRIGVIGAGLVTTAVAGWILDRLRVSRLVWPWVYLAAAAFLCVSSVTSYESYQRAMSKNGSLTAYILFSLNLSLYLTCLSAISWNVLTRVWRRIRRK